MSNKIIDAKGNVHYVGNKRLVDLETGEEFNAQTILNLLVTTISKNYFFPKS